MATNDAAICQQRLRKITDQNEGWSLELIADTRIFSLAGNAVLLFSRASSDPAAPFE